MLVKALRFSQVDPDAVDLHDIPETLRPTNDKWLAGCSPSDRELLDRELGQALAKWGYPPFSAETDAPTPVGVSRRALRA